MSLSLIKRSYILVKFSADYCGEWTCEEFRAFKNQKKYDKWLEEISGKISSGDREFWFGRNHYLKFNDVESLRECLSIKYISKSEYKILRKYFKDCFGDVRLGTRYVLD